MVPLVPEPQAIPAELLWAVAQRQGLVALVVGAGCSLEAPTGLKLARDYAEDVHRLLVADGVLVDGDCVDPTDLSLVATAVHDRTGSQAPLVERLPRNEYRTARANDGYLYAAALLREGVVSCVLTLNFDLAMSNALSDLSANDVSVIAGPTDLAQLGTSAIIYLHRNVDEGDLERWILRQEALEEEWRDDWQAVVAQRVMAAPVTVFAGLGSPAAVLTETITRIRAAVADVLKTYVVDPAAAAPFHAALNLPPEAHIRLGWGDFMRRLAARVGAEHLATLEEACRVLSVENGWPIEEGEDASLCRRFTDLGLVLVGKIKARWLLDKQAYAPDDHRRELVADLLLAIGVVEKELGGTSYFREDGVVEFRGAGSIVAVVLPASGAGTRRWASLESRLRAVASSMRPDARPTSAIVGGVQGGRPEMSPPEDVVVGDSTDDILGGRPAIQMFLVDELHGDPSLIRNAA